MRIGIAIGDIRGQAPFIEVVDQVRQAAEGGFATAWCAQALGWDALTTLAVAGAAVPGIALGTAVIPTPQRHPLVLASQALTTQAAVAGRLTLGIGAGIGAMVTGMFGLAADRPAHRMREYVAVLNPLLRGEAVDHHGESLTAAGGVALTGVAPPAVVIAALGPSMLRVAGELADGTVTWMTGPKTLREYIAPTIAKAAAAAGRPRPQIVAGQLVCLTNDMDAVRDRIGTQFAMAGQTPEYRAMLDREGASGPQDVAIVGSERTVAQHVEQLRDAGVTEFMAAPYGSDEEQRRTAKLLVSLAG
jgi:F420-dependent oxidoreductase-like protein